MVLKINFEKKFARKLGMQSTVIKLFNDLENETGVKLDFKNVEFMNRLLHKCIFTKKTMFYR